MQTWMTIATFVWFLVGQTWLYDAENCTTNAHVLYVYCFVLIIVTFVRLTFPLVLLLLICVVLPFLILYRLVFPTQGPNAGSSETVINNLPTRYVRSVVPVFMCVCVG